MDKEVAQKIRWIIATVLVIVQTLLLIAIGIYAILQLPPSVVCCMGVIVLLIVTIASWFAWEKLLTVVMDKMGMGKDEVKEPAKDVDTNNGD